MSHLLVTNDFPPKLGGIQSYLWELWRRLPPGEATVLTTAHAGADEFDRRAPLRVERVDQRFLLPHRGLAKRVDALADEVGAAVVLLDPALPLGLIGPRLEHRYGVIVHGAEVTVPGRLPGCHGLLARVLRGASIVIAAGGYPAAEAERAAGRSLPVTIVPPGVDAAAFVPLEGAAKSAARARLGLPVQGPLVASVSRLVPRKGMDVLIEAASRLSRTTAGLTVAIAGQGRDRRRLDRLVVSTGAPVRILGRLPTEELRLLYGCADVFAMLCRDRWGGLEQEGFGIVFLEAAASGVASVAGDSGGAAEAVVHGETGLVVGHPGDVDDVAAALGALLHDPDLARRYGLAGRQRVLDCFDHDRLAERMLLSMAGL